MVRQERLDHQPSATPPRSEQPRRLGEQRHRLFSGTVTRCQQLAIEVQEGDDIGGLDTMEHRLGTDIHVGGRQRTRVSSGDRDDSPPGGSFQLLAQAGDPGTQVGESRPTALLTHRRSPGGAPSARQLAVVVEADGRVATGAAQQRPARPAGEDPRPPRGVVHANHPSMAVPERRR